MLRAMSFLVADRGFCFLLDSRVVRMMADHEVQMCDDRIGEFYVKFLGPKDSKLYIWFRFFFFWMRDCVGGCVE